MSRRKIKRFRPLNYFPFVGRRRIRRMVRRYRRRR